MPTLHADVSFDGKDFVLVIKRLQQFRCVLLVRAAHTVWTSWRSEKASKGGRKKNPIAVCCLKPGFTPLNSSIEGCSSQDLHVLPKMAAC